MEKVIELFGYLIISFLGIVAPVLLILLSMFREGILKLSSQYENERAQSEHNIKEQLKKIGQAERTDIAKIQQGLNELKVIKKVAEVKLSFLNPKKQTQKLFMPLFISFCGVLVSTFMKDNIYVVLISVTISVGCFVYALYVLWKLLGVIIEVRKYIDDDKKAYDTKTIELLSTLADKVKQDTKFFLKKVYIILDNKNIENEIEIKMTSDKKQEFKVGIRNSEPRMAKYVEAGLIFPSDFIIDKKDKPKLFTDETKQIVRYEVDMLHGNTDYVFSSSLVITPLKKGEFKIKTFIKAENIESTYRWLKLVIS